MNNETWPANHNTAKFKGLAHLNSKTQACKFRINKMLSFLNVNGYKVFRQFQFSKLLPNYGFRESENIQTVIQEK